jgi:carboxypeptidase Taq
MRRIADVRNATAVLQWDQETYLPPKGAVIRGQQIATLTELSHILFTEEETGALLQELAGRGDLAGTEKRNVELNLEDYLRQKKYEPAFVRKLSESISVAFHAWMAARKEHSFGLFEKALDEVVRLKRQEAAFLGYTGHPYDALIYEFEKGATVAMLDKTFSDLAPKLKDLMDSILGGRPVDDSFLHQLYPRQTQWEFGLELIRKLGFDMGSGRQDLSEHPFTTSFNSNDVRITTRIDEYDVGGMTWSCIHEAGHALYEQGLPVEQYGLPSGEFATLSIHESQSRLWENQVGRSLEFWKAGFPIMKGYFPSQLGAITLEQFYAGIHTVKPSFIRTESDEVSYHFHILIRYELEKKLIEGSLSTAEIPYYWAEQYRKWLGLKVEDDNMGCLQDVHWSHGSFGYFPTYSLGSFYAAQLFRAACSEYPDLQASMSSGDLGPVQYFLRQRIYPYGRILTSEELCKKATGEVLDVAYFMQYLVDKYEKIYQF